MALRAPGETAVLLLEKPAISLRAAVPAARFHAADWRSPQLVRQVDIDDRSRLFLQAAIQIFSSPLQRIGAEKAGAAESRGKS